MNLFTPVVAISLVIHLTAAEVPKIFAPYFQVNVPIKAQVGMVLPPPEIDKYIDKVQTAARKDPKWFREHSLKAKNGNLLDYDPRIGLTQAEYDEYIALWNKRQFRANEEVTLMLRHGSNDTWTMTCTESASSLSTLRYSSANDSFQSPNGTLKKGDEIKSDATGIFGEWTGQEWKFEEESSLGKTRESLALGQFADGKFGVIIYRAQELSSEGTRLLDQSIVVRFPMAQGKDDSAPKPSVKK